MINVIISLSLASLFLQLLGICTTFNKYLALHYFGKPAFYSGVFLFHVAVVFTVFDTVHRAFS